MSDYNELKALHSMLGEERVRQKGQLKLYFAAWAGLIVAGSIAAGIVAGVSEYSGNSREKADGGYRVLVP